MQAIYEDQAQASLTASPLCPICFGAHSLGWGFRTVHAMFECQSCGVVFFDRARFELHDYQTYYEYTDDWDDARVKWEMKIRRRALTKQLARIGTYVNGRTLLDVGAGPGYLCRIACDNGWDARGIEVSAKARRIGKQFLRVEYVDIARVEDESLDVITCHHVLEHMTRPDEFIRELRTKLKPSGVVVIHVPHREPLSFLIRNTLNGFKAAQTERLCALYIPEHVLGFTQASLTHAFSLFGFQPLFVRTSAMWSVYYDPFFLKNYLRENDYLGILQHTLRCLIDNVGVLVGRGDWVIGHFRKA